jgi:hypothetical protein
MCLYLEGSRAKQQVGLLPGCVAYELIDESWYPSCSVMIVLVPAAIFFL